MPKMFLALIEIVVAILVCLGRCSGTGPTLLTELTEDDWQVVCDHVVDEDEEDRVVDCDGTEVIVEARTVEDCLAMSAQYTSEECTADFNDWVDCWDEDWPTDGQICGTEEYVLSLDCEAVETCIGG